ncbi:c-type cytochrome [Hyphomonas sp.]|jgi:cytochrome c|uniref:c-type cytochrome n=1 Tax=Hyphomonas sp. TaxID=87 RepID=UPI000C634BCB|nr:cytochrome c family protein [Hyphomonadaceae bacterium]MBA28726.1 cytochrome c family protein [Hyphomonadaceae bacterium]|tara:strand:+ start:178 stop:732 length:555 start_codon:yes stop_codon:yes gene_type:complete
MKMTSSLAIAAVMVLAACGKSEAPAPETPPAATPAAEAPAETAATPAAAPNEAVEAAADAVSPFAALPAPYNTADYARGRRTWKLCQSCHITAEGGGNLVGPNLHGLFGREAGTLEGFAYSPALQEADFIWTPDKVDHWLENPRTFLPGNRMTFAGVRKPDDRIAVVAYLMSETGYEAEDVPAE